MHSLMASSTLSGPRTDRSNSCCLLKRTSGRGYFKKGQGVIFRFVSKKNPAVLTDSSLALLTCHHLIPSKKAVNDWNVIYGDGDILQLKESMVTRFFTCCGKDGILGKVEHADASEDEYLVCPFNLDFSLIILNPVDALPPRIKLVRLRNANLWRYVDLVYYNSQALSHKHYKDIMNLEVYRRKDYNVICEFYESWELAWSDSRLSWFKIPYRKNTMIGEGASGSPGYVVVGDRPIIVGMRNEMVLCGTPSIEEECSNTRTVLACVNVPWLILLLNAYENECDIKFMRAIYKLYKEYSDYAKEDSLLKKAERLLQKDFDEKHCDHVNLDDYHLLVDNLEPIIVDSSSYPSYLQEHLISKLVQLLTCFWNFFNYACRPDMKRSLLMSFASISAANSLPSGFMRQISY